MSFADPKKIRLTVRPLRFAVALGSALVVLTMAHETAGFLMWGLIGFWVLLDGALARRLDGAEGIPPKLYSPVGLLVIAVAAGLMGAGSIWVTGLISGYCVPLAFGMRARSPNRSSEAL